jgi:hypothetical protein
MLRTTVSDIKPLEVATVTNGDRNDCENNMR